MSQPHPVIVVIEDDPQIRRFLRTGLEAHGFEIHEAETGKLGMILAATRKPDLVILDLGLPDIDGLEVVKKLREWTSRPVIILSARNMETDKVAALDTGADDYLTKPFGMDELLARIRAALRRATPELEAPVVSMGRNSIDLSAKRVTNEEGEVRLTPTEWQLLELLVRNAGKLVSQRQILQTVWGPAYTTETNYLRVYLAQLRRKLEDDPSRPRYLITEPGMGYRFEPDA